MRAAMNTAHRVVQALAKSAYEVRADELSIRRNDPIARAGIRHPIGARLDRVNSVVPVDRHAHVHRVDRIAGRAVAGQQHEVVILDVVEMRIDVEETIVALKALVGHSPRMKALAGY